MPSCRCPSCGASSHSADGHPTVGLCPKCATPRGSASAWLRPGGPVLRRNLPARPESPGEARRSVATWAALADAARARLDLVVTELVTNAVRHARSGPLDRAELDQPIYLLVTQKGNEVRVAVHDRGRGFSPGEVAAERTEGGLGLLIVDSLSTAWGVDCGSNGSGSVGCTVWCTLDTERAA